MNSWFSFLANPIRTEKRSLPNIETVCNQGCRPYNEDMIYMDKDCVYPCEEPHFNVFGILDGHGGIEAVRKLHALMCKHFNDKERIRSGLEPIRFYNNIFALESFYHKAKNILEYEKSGVVSCLALVSRQKVVFGWLGDCEGCVFDRSSGSFFDPIYNSKDKAMSCFREMDFSEKEYANEKYLNWKRVLEPICHAKTRAHNFEKSVEVASNCQWKWYPGIPRNNLSCVSYKSVNGVIPSHFLDSNAQKEYQLMCLKSGEIVKLDVCIMKIGEYEQVLDTRLTCAIQPTRSLGDFSASNAHILRECCIMEVDLNSSRYETKENYHILLCSDGFFHGCAFSGIEKLCSFFIDPILFIRLFFYHEEQEVTLRLMACGLLPRLREGWESASIEEFNLLDAWRKFDIIIFLTQSHMNAIQSVSFRSTYDAGSIENYEHWLRVCKKSCVWLSSNEVMKDLSTFASHLAILMGSQDNISALVAKV